MFPVQKRLFKGIESTPRTLMESKLLPVPEGSQEFTLHLKGNSYLKEQKIFAGLLRE